MPLITSKPVIDSDPTIARSDGGNIAVDGDVLLAAQAGRAEATAGIRAIEPASAITGSMTDRIHSES